MQDRDCKLRSGRAPNMWPIYLSKGQKKRAHRLLRKQLVGSGQEGVESFKWEGCTIMRLKGKSRISNLRRVNKVWKKGTILSLKRTTIHWYWWYTVSLRVEYRRQDEQPSRWGLRSRLVLDPKTTLKMVCVCVWVWQMNFWDSLFSSGCPGTQWQFSCFSLLTVLFKRRQCNSSLMFRLLPSGAWDSAVAYYLVTLGRFGR